jgi:subtilisin family serine protease
MPHTDLPSYRDGFFEKFLADLPGAPTLQSLEAQQPAGQPLVLMGDYIEYTGGPVAAMPNASIAPRFAIRTGTAGAPQTFVTLWIVERFDVATDSQETIARILADFRPATETGAAESDSLTSDLARSWATALTADSVRQALARNFTTITDVPAGLPTTDIDELRAFLQHFGTYKPDGTYYTKGTVAEGSFPAGVSDAYFAPDTGNLAEVRVERDRFYCYALAAERLWNPQADASRFRQLVYRIEDRGADAGADRWRLALLHTVGTTVAGPNPASRFVFYFAEVGLGLAVPATATSSLAATTASLVESLQDSAVLERALGDPQIPVVGTTESPIVLLIGAVKAGFPTSPLPDGVVEDGEGAVRTFRCPPEHVIALAARDDVDNLVLSTPVWLTMTNAMQEMNAAGRTFPAGTTAANAGRGVVVGIVDSGIDGGHPAFLGRADDATKSRIHSVWHLWEKGGESPFKRSGNKAEYKSMAFGKEYVGESEVTTTQDYSSDGAGGFRSGHGTHVAGIAAGRAFGTWPGGLAPAATIVVAGIGSDGGYVNDVVAGVKYCFQKAKDLGNLPCVVNISLGTEHHSHDGTDPLSIALTQLVSQDLVPAAGLGSLVSAMPGYKDGRIIVAAAGNLRGDDLHWQATIPAGGQVSVLYQPFGPNATSGNTNDGVTFWAYNEDATTVRLRVSARHSTNAVLATAEVPLRGSNGRVTTNLPGGLQVNIHNGPESPNNRHYNPEVYWIRSAGGATAPWIIRLRNDGRSPCVVHGFGAYREHRGRFITAAAVTQPRIGVTYTAAQLRQFESCKVGTPGTAAGVITVAAYTSRATSASDTVDELAWFSSPGPLRAAAPGQRAIDCAMPGHAISSAKSWMPNDASRTVVDKSGTSMAAPMLTGLVAGLLQQDPTLNTGQVVVRVENAARRRATDTVDDWGLGRIDAALFRA